VNDATARLRTPSGTGTAWLCSRGYALTAAHCVEAWQHNPNVGLGYAHDAGDVVLEFSWNASLAVAEVVHFDLGLDACLLRLPDGAVPSHVQPIPLAVLLERTPWPTGPFAVGWTADGFPRAHPPGMTLSGTITNPNQQVEVTFPTSPRRTYPAIQLFCEQGGLNELEGASGAAVCCAGVAVGLIRKGILGQKVPFAAPMKDIVGAFPEVQKILSTSPPPAGWEERLFALQLVSGRFREAERDEYLNRAVPDLERRTAQRLRPAAPRTEPYQFLYAYDIQDTDVFFGRDAACDKLHKVVAKDRLTVLHAPSGAGKTSLLQAGLGPRLIREGSLPVYARMYGDPAQAVKRAIAPPSLGPWPEMLAELHLPEFLGLVCARLSRRTRELVLILDQFEELFILASSAAQRRAFLNDLSACYFDKELPVRMIIGVRKDYFSDLVELEEEIDSVFRNHFHLPPMSREEASLAIAGPVAKVDSKVTYDPTLLGTLLDDLGRGGMQLPYLQIVCSRLYEKRGGTDVIRLEAYEALGRIEGVLVNYLHQTLSQLPGEDRELARRILAALVTGEGTKQPLRFDELAGRIGPEDGRLVGVLGRLVGARLLHRDDAGEGIIYELAHDYLAAEVRRWLTVVPAGKQLKMIQEALLNAFDHNSLRRMLMFELNVDLDHVAPAQSSLIDVTYQLVRYFAAQPNGLQRLLAGARANNPGNLELARTATALSGVQFEPLPLAEQSGGQLVLPEENTPALQVNEEQLRLLQDPILAAFDLPDLQQLVTFQLDVRLEHIVPVYNRTLRDIVADLLYYYAKQPGGLERLVDAAVAARPQNATLTHVAELFRGRKHENSSAASLTAAQLQILHTQLLNLASQTDLKRLVKELFNERLDSIAAPGPFSQVAFEMLQHYMNQQGALYRLFARLQQDHPNSHELIEAVALLEQLDRGASAGQG
jgi:hypothetical protein